MKKVAFYTLGCKVNQYETQAMSELFAKNGYIICNFDEVCDVYVINSCTVTGTGDKKSRHAIRKAKRTNPDSICVMTGCYAQSLTKEQIDDIGADIVIGTGNRDKIIDAVNSGIKTSYVDKLSTHRQFEETPIEKYDHKTRAMLKIEDGCDRFCSYCIIPYVRGPVRSRSMESIVSETKRLAQHGFKEIVLTGIQVAAYGSDNKCGSLTEVIEKVAEVDEIKRIRLSSMEVLAITEDFMKRVFKTGKLCPSFHLSLQSGCDTVLKRMNRRYTAEQYEKCVELIRKFYPDAAITTDIIAGFPGETEQEFMNTLEFAEKIGFAKIHAFPYSAREGTKAALMDNQIEKSVKEQRVKELIKLDKKMHNEFIDAQKGKCFDVLFERQNDEGFFEGFTSNYISVKVKSNEPLQDRIVKIELNDENIHQSDEM